MPEDGQTCPVLLVPCQDDVPAGLPVGHLGQTADLG